MSARSVKSVRSLVQVCSRSMSGVSASANKQQPPLSPAVWHLIENNRLDPSSIIGTGKGGRLLKGDVLLALQNKSAQPRKDSKKTLSAPTPTLSSTSSASSNTFSSSLRRARGHRDIPVSDSQKAAAQKAGTSKKSVPHSYATISCSTAVIHDTLSQLKQRSKVDISVRDFVVMAASRALRAVPEVNSVCPQGEPQTLDSINIGVALPTPAGIVTPVLENVGRMGLAQIANQTKQLVAEAQNSATDKQCSLTIYNLPDVTSFSAVINPPQAAILAVGSSTGHSLNATLSLDARVGDDSVAAKWLSAFQHALENPAL